MGLDHDFLLLDRTVDGEWNQPGFVHDPRALKLHDDLVRYLGDTLNWIPTLNPSRNEAQQGLCLWGATIIDIQGAEVAGRVFKAWSQLFAVGPETISLTGQYSWSGDDEAQLRPVSERVTQLEGGYDRLEFPRDRVVKVLRQLAEYAERVQSSGGRLYLLHRGV